MGWFTHQLVDPQAPAATIGVRWLAFFGLWGGWLKTLFFCWKVEMVGMGFMGLVLVSIELFLQIFVDFFMVNSSVKKPIPWGGI